MQNIVSFILAAGLGTRLKPLTDVMPKALVPVGGTPLIDIVRERLRAEGFEQQVVNVHHFGEQIIAHLASTTVKISDERDMLRDTGGALCHAASLLNDADKVLVHNVDILSNAHLRQLVGQSQGTDAMLLVSRRPSSRQLLFYQHLRLVGWTNVQTGEVRTPHEGLEVERCISLAFAGIHVIDRSLLDDMKGGGECFSVIDFYLAQCLHRRIYGYVQPDLQLLDVGKVATLGEAEQFLKCTMHNAQFA